MCMFEIGNWYVGSGRTILAEIDRVKWVYGTAIGHMIAAIHKFVLAHTHTHSRSESLQGKPGKGSAHVTHTRSLNGFPFEQSLVNGHKSDSFHLFDIIYKSTMVV